MRQKLPLLFIIGIVVISAAIFLLTKDKNISQQQNNQSQTCLKINISSAECDYNLDIADSYEERAQGLSDRDPLQLKTGMLFIFEDPSRQCFWMKDMKFSIDMIWLDQNKQIIKIENSVKPETYPNSFCADSTKYVVEIPSGDAAKHELTTGKQVSF